MYKFFFPCHDNNCDFRVAEALALSLYCSEGQAPYFFHLRIVDALALPLYSSEGQAPKSMGTLTKTKEGVLQPLPFIKAYTLFGDNLLGFCWLVVAWFE